MSFKKLSNIPNPNCSFSLIITFLTQVIFIFVAECNFTKIKTAFWQIIYQYLSHLATLLKFFEETSAFYKSYFIMLYYIQSRYDPNASMLYYSAVNRSDKFCPRFRVTEYGSCCGGHEQNSPSSDEINSTHRWRQDSQIVVPIKPYTHPHGNLQGEAGNAKMGSRRRVSGNIS